MKKFILPILLGTLTISFQSCGNKQKGEEPKSEENAVDSSKCVYTFVNDSTLINWTAFKTPEKVGVGGSFTEFEVMGNINSNNPKEVIESILFKIPVASVNSKNPDRDGKITRIFFGNMENTENIEGSFHSLIPNEENANNGEGMITISMNGVQKDMLMNYTFDNGRVNIMGTMDVNEWNAQHGIKALNDTCYDLHKSSPDGESKLWPNVDISISGFLAQKCD